MPANKRIPDRDQLRDYGHAVAGHAGTMCTDDGEIFVKPCTQAEIDFYESANRRHPEFADLMPLYLGTLKLSDPADVKVDDVVAGIISDSGHVETTKEQIAASVAQQVAHAAAAGPGLEPADTKTWVPNKSKKIKTDTAVVLDNASYGFKKANILDAKLGVRLWADDAPEDKKTRFDAITKSTTHGPMGFRIAGMRVYHGSDDKAEWDEDGFKVYDKDYGRCNVGVNNITDAMRNFVFNDAAGITEELGQAVCSAFVHDLVKVEKVLSSHESRMYSASLLFVFEGDGDALRDAIEENNAAVEAVDTAKPIRRANIRVDSGIALADDEQIDDSDNETDFSSLPRIYTLKLIDFAHAQWTPGQGPDKNIIKGVQNLKQIFSQLAQ